MKKTVLLILLFTFIHAFAQKLDETTVSRPLNIVSVNLFGDASAISLNYERLFQINDHFVVSSKLGLGYNEEFKLCLWESPCIPDTFITMPHHITGNLGKKQHFFEFGLGGTALMGGNSNSYIMYPTVGYRIVPLRKNRLNFRIFAQYPLWGGFKVLFMPVGVNLGLSF